MGDRQIKPFYAVIFGGDGDLAMRKIIPAFYHRFVDEQLTMPFKIVCISRRLSDEVAFKEHLVEFIEKSFKSTAKLPQIDAFLSHLTLLMIPTNNSESFQGLKNCVEEEKSWQRVFYFSVPSAAFSEICTTLKSSNLLTESCKVVLEKPLGNSLQSSQEINTIISSAFKE